MTSQTAKDTIIRQRAHSEITRQNALAHVLRRHSAFWDMEEVDTPLISIGRHTPLQPRQPVTLADGAPVWDGDLLLPELVETCSLVDRPTESEAVVCGDFIYSRAPYDLCWTEAIAGCPIRWRAGHVWAAPFLNDLNDIERLRVAPGDPWLAKLLEITQVMVAQAADAYPVSQPLMRGPVDIASAVLGDEPLCWAMMDEPERFRRLLDRCTDVFIAVARAWREATPPFHGGYCLYGIWAPGTSVRMQADNAALMSPQLYRDFLLPCDARISAAFDYPLMHTHSGVLHIMADALLSLDALRAIQVSLDCPAGPTVKEILPLLKRVNARKPLIITGAVTPDECDMLIKALSPEGLSLQVDLHST